MHCPKCNQDVSTHTNGLNQTGIILVIVLIVFCFPLFWIPFVVDSCKKHICNNCGMPLE